MMMNFNETDDRIARLSEAYASLVILSGVGMKEKPRSLTIKVEPENYGFARLLAREAYKAGAKFVDIELDDLKLTAYRQEIQDIGDFSRLPSFSKPMNDLKLDEDWAYIRVDALESLDSMAACDPDKISARARSRIEVLKRWSDEFMANLHPWCVVAYPNREWAGKVFSGSPDAVKQLWDLLIPILHLDSQDPAGAWMAEGRALKARQEALNALRIKTLHYFSPVTDFTIGFRPEALWCGGGETLPDGQFFFPNIPTAEVFTAPDRLQADGYITTTRPVSVLNQETRNVRLNFKDGKVTSFSAGKGAAIMEKFLDIDEGTRHIGECALVDENSPIARSNRIFGSILYDENASCHLALGQAYKDCVRGGETLRTPEELESMGLNDSLMHVDFMVGSPETCIEAETFDGKTVRIMEKGCFCL